jgi:hypothetical protein
MGSIQSECIDNVIISGEARLRPYASYYNPVS